MLNKYIFIPTWYEVSLFLSSLSFAYTHKELTVFKYIYIYIPKLKLMSSSMESMVRQFQQSSDGCVLGSEIF